MPQSGLTNVGPSATHQQKANIGSLIILLYARRCGRIQVSGHSGSIFLNISSSHYHYFSRPQRRVPGFSWMFFPLKMQKPCKTITSIFWVHILKHIKVPLPPFPKTTEKSIRVFMAVFPTQDAEAI